MLQSDMREDLPPKFSHFNIKWRDHVGVMSRCFITGANPLYARDLALMSSWRTHLSDRCN